LIEKTLGAAYIKNENQIRITTNEFKNIIYVHVREYQMDGDTGNWFPTAKGYSILGNEVDSVIELLQEASDYITQETFYRFNDQYELIFEEETMDEHESLV